MTLNAIFARPTRLDIAWADVVSLFNALGATVKQGKGSRVRIGLNGQAAVFHEPHPQRVTDKGSVESVRAFLAAAGIVP